MVSWDIFGSLKYCFCFKDVFIKKSTLFKSQFLIEILLSSEYYFEKKKKKEMKIF